MKNEKETKKNLQEAARKEFMELGFQKASLRNICKNAGVTTGALYFFFKDKNDLFASLVREVADEVRQIVIEHIKLEKKVYTLENTDSSKIALNGVAQSREVVCYMYEHRDTILLLLSKSRGSDYENYIDEIVSIMEKDTKLFMMEMLGEEFTKSGLSAYSYHWFAHIEVMSFVNMILHDLTLDEALEQAEVVANFLAGGWMAMVKQTDWNHQCENVLKS